MHSTCFTVVVWMYESSTYNRLYYQHNGVYKMQIDTNVCFTVLHPHTLRVLGDIHVLRFAPSNSVFNVDARQLRPNANATPPRHARTPQRPLLREWWLCNRNKHHILAYLLEILSAELIFIAAIVPWQVGAWECARAATASHLRPSAAAAHPH